MGKVIVEQIVSIDGYAEDAAGGIGFFTDAQAVNAADQEQLRMLRSVGAIVLGARTYRMFADYWPQADPAAEPVAAPIRELPKFVVSSSLEAAPWGADQSATLLRGDGVAAVRGLRGRIAGDLVVWGSLTLADALFEAGEVDMLRLRIVPALLGRGRPFAPAGSAARRWSLARADHFEGGLVVLEYHAAA
ncbi:dihydrofolate reductase family protein [Pseudoxanthomonas suwonensis]|uniref:dihydrofolate reductase family protein n=1 Tax=Pseudoxanthomonas suwonensis TaxID=314722 RepID=UPI0006967596|nr:dihydrofolate reductase family protein [Pseudoxanthomonas suwonensis]